MVNLNKVVSHGVIAESTDDYIGKVGDLTVDSTIAQVYWHDGVTPGGFPLIDGAESNGGSWSRGSGLRTTADWSGNGVATVSALLENRFGTSMPT